MVVAWVVGYPSVGSLDGSFNEKGSQIGSKKGSLFRVSGLIVWGGWGDVFGEVFVVGVIFV